MHGATWGYVTAYLFPGYYPTGDYTFTATATDIHGLKSGNPSRCMW